MQHCRAQNGNRRSLRLFAVLLAVVGVVGLVSGCGSRRGFAASPSNEPGATVSWPSSVALPVHMSARPANGTNGSSGLVEFQLTFDRGADVTGATNPAYVTLRKWADEVGNVTHMSAAGELARIAVHLDGNGIDFGQGQPLARDAVAELHGDSDITVRFS